MREKASSGKAVLVDMEGSRFTVVCRNSQNGIEICSIHHSMPYIDQGEDEYYPKSLATLANEAVQKSRALERRVEMDHMTELDNRVDVYKRQVYPCGINRSYCHFLLFSTGKLKNTLL